MLKKVIIWVVASLGTVAVLAGAAVGATVWGRDRQAQAHAQYESLMENLEQATLTVTEGEETVGVYDLETLGMMEDAKAAAEACFSSEELLTAEEFVAKPIWEQWLFQSLETERSVTLDTETFDPTYVYIDLLECERVTSTDAAVEWTAEGYVVNKEVYGTELDFDIVVPQLEQAVAQWTATPEAMEQRNFDVAELDAYLQPQVLAADEYDFKAMLQEATQDLRLPVKLLTETVELPVQALVSVDDEGKSTINEVALTQLVEEWTAQLPQEETDYILDSYERGPVALDFLKVIYSVDKEALLKQLTEQVSMLDATELKVPYTCTRNGELFELGDTYVEVDIARQKMAYFHKGEVITFTDVVTGLPWGYWTWPGLYAVENKDTDCQLTGPDYSVHVDYWIGYNGPYGIHDADWREIFGNDRYMTNGSHGCVNTPKENVEKIYEKIEVGVPVIVHFVEMDEEPAEEA